MNTDEHGWKGRRRSEPQRHEDTEEILSLGLNSVPRCLRGFLTLRRRAVLREVVVIQRSGDEGAARTTAAT